MILYSRTTAGFTLDLQEMDSFEVDPIPITAMKEKIEGSTLLNSS